MNPRSSVLPSVRRFARLSLALLLLGALGACKKSEELPADPAAVSGSVKDAFAKSSGETKALADAVRQSLESQDTGRAFATLHELNGRPDLTDDQRGAAAVSMSVLGKQLREAALKGDKQAADLLDSYRAAK